MAVEQLADVARRAQVEQVLHGEVDGDVQVEPVGAPGRELRERGLQHVQGQRPHQRGVLGVREERAGSAQAVDGVLPAHERLDAGDASGREVDLRLVVQDELVALERAAQLGDQREPLARVTVTGRVVGLKARARVLGLVHGDVGALQQRVGVGAVLGAQGRPDAGVHHDLEPLDLERVLERDSEPPPDFGRAGEVRAREHQRELVAAEPRDEPGLTDRLLQAGPEQAASNGSVNAMHDSFTPLGGMMPIILMQLGEIIFGGVGSGLYGMLLFVIIAMFVAGLMVGRTPEYLGKKIEAKEVKMAMLAILILPLSILGFMAVATVTPFGLSSIQDAGPHGFSEIMYLYSSSTGNNGSAFAGFTGNTPWYNITGGLAMLIGRYFVIIPAMAVAGSLVAKKTVPASAGTFPTHGGLFVGLLVGVILIIGGLTFFPALALGPIAEHFAMQAKMLF